MVAGIANSWIFSLLGFFAYYHYKMLQGAGDGDADFWEEKEASYNKKENEQDF